MAPLPLHPARGILRHVAAVPFQVGGEATWWPPTPRETNPSMTLLLAAVGAVLTVLLELTVGTYLRIEGVAPHLVLVLGVVVVIAIGFEHGIIWAFVGGIALDVLAQRPLGASAFALLVCIGGASVLARSFPRLRPLLPMVAVLLVSLLYSMILFVAFGALGTPIRIADPVGAALPAVLYDVILAGAVGPLVVALHDRSVAQERVDW
jgi:rod shape-determining protein MreD